MIKTVKPGLLTTVQDEGRWGYQAYGMPVAGAMDRYAYRVANLLAGNRRGAPVLEMTMLGGAFEFQEKCLVSVCGADMQVTLDGTRVPNWSAFYAPEGGLLSFDNALAGCRTYRPSTAESRCHWFWEVSPPYTRAHVGGMGGGPLKEGVFSMLAATAAWVGCPGFCRSTLYLDMIRR